MNQAKFVVCAFLVLFQLYYMIDARPQDDGISGTGTTTPGNLIASDDTTSSATGNPFGNMGSQLTNTANKTISNMFPPSWGQMMSTFNIFQRGG